MSERDEPEGTTRLITTWTYDATPSGRGKLVSETGKLATSISPEFKRTYTYDALSRPQSTTTIIDGNQYTSAQSYAQASRVSVITYPTGFRVRNRYNLQGYFYQVENADDPTLIYSHTQAVNAYGQVEQEVLDEAGNNAGDLSITRAYDLSAGRLKSIRAVAPGGSIQNLKYDFDTLGNLEYRQDLGRGLREDYVYDSLNRLRTTLTTSGGITLTKRVEFDELGNIKSKTGAGVYTYHATRPHVLTTIGAATYGYDANGNLISGAAGTFTFNAANLPTRITKGNATLSFSYGPDRARYKQVATVNGQTETTLYVSGSTRRPRKAGWPPSVTTFKPMTTPSPSTSRAAPPRPKPGICSKIT